MKYLTLSAFLLALIGCTNNTAKTTEEAPAIEGMTCAHGCAATIEKNLNKTEGVSKAVVDFDSKTATISFDAHKLSKESLISVIEGSNGGDSYKVIP